MMHAIQQYSNTDTDMESNTTSANPAISINSGIDEETRAALRAAALEFGKIQHTYRIPHGFMGYGGSGAWD
jgi:hypothetical protein